MNKILLGTLLLSLGACTPKQNNSSTQNANDTIVNLAAKSGVVTGSGDFGTLNPSDASKMLTFKITNNGTEPLVGPATVDNTNFSIAYQNCASVKVKSSCTIKVSFDPKSKSGPYSANLMLDSVFASLSATVNVPVVTPSVDYLISGVSVTSVNFGQMTDKQSMLKSISIKNTGSQALTDTVVIPSGYTLSYDTCSGKAIAKGSSCAIKVTLSGAGKSGIIAGDLVYGGKSLPLSGEVIAPSTFSNVVFMNGTATSTSYDFGSISGANSKQLILTIKNTGSGSATLASAALSSSNMSIVYNQCVNLSLAPSASCQVRVLFSASGKTPQAYSSILSFGDKSFTLSGTVSSASVVVTNAPMGDFSLDFYNDGSTLPQTSGSARFPISYNNKIYYGVDSWFFSGSSLAMNSVGQAQATIINPTAAFFVTEQSPLINFQGKIYNWMNPTPLISNEFKLVSIDALNNVSEFSGQIPGEASSGIITNGDNGFMKMTSNGQYLIIIRNENPENLIVVDSNLQVSLSQGELAEVIFDASSGLGVFIGNDYYFLSGPNLFNRVLKKMNLTTKIVSSVLDSNNNPLLANVILGTTNNNSKIWLQRANNSELYSIRSYDTISESVTLFTNTSFNNIETPNVSTAIKSDLYKVFQGINTHYLVTQSSDLLKISDSGVEFLGRGSLTNPAKPWAFGGFGFFTDIRFGGIVLPDGGLMFRSVESIAGNYSVSIKLLSNQKNLSTLKTNTAIVSNEYENQPYSRAFNNNKTKKDFAIQGNKILFLTKDATGGYPTGDAVETYLDLTTMAVTVKSQKCVDDGEFGMPDLDMPLGWSTYSDSSAFYAPVRKCTTGDYRMQRIVP